MHGTGTKIEKDGTKYEGKFVPGRLIEGKITLTNGVSMEGTFDKNHKL